MWLLAAQPHLPDPPQVLPLAAQPAQLLTPALAAGLVQLLGRYLRGAHLLLQAEQVQQQQQQAAVPALSLMLLSPLLPPRQQSEEQP